MNWFNSIDSFLQKRKTSLSFYRFFCNTLDLNKKNSTDKWRCLLHYLKEWNKNNINEYENISLCSPVMWKLNICINSFILPKNINNINNWLYWAYFSSYINYCVSNELLLKNENRLNPQEYFLKCKENMGVEVEEFLNDLDQEDILLKKYICIDKKIFLQELAQKRESSYKKLISMSSNIKDKEKYILSRIHMYEQYEKYEKMFQNTNELNFEIVEINPQGMNNLFDDCMCYSVKIGNQVYIVSAD